MILSNKRKILFFLVLLITILSCSIVSATDTNNDTSPTVQSSTQIENTVETSVNENMNNDINTISEESINKDSDNANTPSANSIINKDDKTLKSGTNGTAVSYGSQLGNSGTYYLVNDITLTSELKIKGSFILDGNGHTITLSDKIKAKDFSGTIEIRNTVFTGSETVKLECGDILVENCTFRGFSDKALEVGDDAKDPTRTTGQLTIVRNCTFINNYDDSLEIKETDALVENCNFINCGVGDGVVIVKRGSAIIKDSNFTSCSHPALYSEKGGVIYIDNLAINGVNQTSEVHSSSDYVIYNKEGSEGKIVFPDIKYETNLIILTNDTTVNTANNIRVRLLETDTNTGLDNQVITITITDTNSTISSIQRLTDDNGYVTVNYTSSFAGTVDILASFDGSSTSYESVSNNTTYTVSKTSSKENVAIEISAPSSAKVNENIEITVSLKDVNSNILTPNNIVISIDGTTVSSTRSGNTLIVNYKPSNIGTIVVNATFNGNTTYEATSSTRSITINSADHSKEATSIVMIDDQDGLNDGFFKTSTPSPVPIKFKVVDSSNNEVNEGSIEIYDFYRSYTLATTIDLSTGIRTYNLNSIKYPIGAVVAKRLKINYIGSDNYEDSNNTFIISILRSKTTKKTNLTVYATNTTTNNNNMIIVTLNTEDDTPISDENVIVSIDDVEYEYTTDSNGRITITDYSSSTAKNNIPVTVNYEGSVSKNLFGALEQSTTFNVIKADSIATNISLVDTHDANNDGRIMAYTNSDAIIEVKVTDPNGTQINQGYVNLIFTGKTEYTIDLSKTNTITYNTIAYNIPATTARLYTLQYIGTGNYDNSNSTFVLSITRNTPLPKISLTATDTTVNKANNITVTLTANNTALAGENVNVNVDGRSYTLTTDSKGVVTINNYTSGTARIVSVVASYDGNYELRYMPSKENSTTFNVINDGSSSNATTISLVDTHDANNDGRIMAYTNSDAIIEVKVTDPNGTQINQGYVNLIFTGKTEYTIDLSKTNTITYNTIAYNIPATTARLYTLQYIGTDNYEDSNTTFVLSITRNTPLTKISVNATDTMINQANIITARLTANNTPLSGETVKINVDGISYSLKTNQDGIATISNYTSGTAKTVLVTANYDGNYDLRYMPTKENTTTFTVTGKLDTTIKVETNNIKPDNFTIKVTVTDEDNNNVTSGKVRITSANNSQQTANVKNSIATFTLNATPGKYTFTSVYLGDATYNPSSNITSTVIIPKHNTTTNVTLTRNNIVNATIKVVIKDDNNNIISNGSVTLTLPDGTNVNTNINKGQVSITLPTSIGSNKITVKYKGDTSNNPSNNTITITNIKHNTTISLNNPQPGYAGLNNLTGTVKDEDGNPLKNVKLNISLNNKTYTAKTNNSGKFITSIDANAGSNDITISYAGNLTQANTTKTLSFNALRLATKVTVNNVQSTVGENMTLIAYVTDQFGRAVESGKLIFKVNERTLKIDGSVSGSASNLQSVVTNGIVNVTLPATLYLRNAQNLTAVYGGTSRYYANSTETAGRMAIRLRDASIVVTTKEITNQDTNLLLTAHVYDITSNNKRSTIRDYDDNYVIFKVNDITLKDSDGNALKAKVVNGTASLNYTVPAGLAGIYTNKTNKLYTVLAIFTSAEYYPTAKNTTQFKVNRSEISFNNIKVVLDSKSRNVTVTASLQDYHNNMLKGQNNIIVKNNGLTYQIDGKNKYFTAINGVVNFTYTLPDNVKTLKNIQLVTTERVGYLGGRNTTTIITII